MSKPTIDREFVSVKSAKTYLDTNTHNRRIKLNKVAQLAAAIKRGEWKDNLETIKFGCNGTLIDGQHRLHAIVAAKKGVTLWVGRNLPLDAQETVDTGVPRSAADALTLREHANANALAATAKILIEAESGANFGTFSGGISAPSVQQIISYVEDNDDIAAYVKYAKWFCVSDRSLKLPNSLVAAAAIEFSAVSSRADALDFFGQVLAPKSSTSPAAKLRQRLQRGARSGPTTLPRSVKSALLIKAWNAYIRGESPGQVKFAPGGAKPEKFPTIQGAPE